MKPFRLASAEISSLLGRNQITRLIGRSYTSILDEINSPRFVVSYTWTKVPSDYRRNLHVNGTIIARQSLARAQENK